MKAIKRNAVIVAVLMFVGLAVYLNWAYNTKDKAAQAAKTEQTETGSTVAAAAQEQPAQEQQLPYYTASENSGQTSSAVSDVDSALPQTVSAYFDSVRLSRSEARDAAVSTLTMVSQAEGAAQETVDDALKRISAMAETAVLESQVESAVCAKGFADCVVYITDDTVSVTVPAGEEGLSTADVARITDAVTECTDYTAAQLRVTEVK